MTYLAPKLFIRTIEGIVESSNTPGQVPQTVRIFTAQGVVEVTTHLTIPPALPSRVQKAVVHVMSHEDDEEPSDHAVWFDWREDIDAFLHFPAATARTENVAKRAREILSGVNHPALREFLSDVFSIPGVFFDYSAGSCAPFEPVGSLMERAVASVDDLLFEDYFFTEERQLATTYAMLRDVGRIWLQAALEESPADATPGALARSALWHLDAPMAHLKANHRLCKNAARTLPFAVAGAFDGTRASHAGLSESQR